MTTALPFAREVERCQSAQRSWAEMPVSERIRPLRRLRRLFVSQADRLVQAVVDDVSRAPAEVLSTDLLPTADGFRYLEKRAGRILRPKTVSLLDRPLWLFGERDVIHRRPHGVVGIIGTWNYPLFLNAGQITNALAAGNGVMWKPSELTPKTSQLLHSLLIEAGFPAELVQLLPATREAGPLLAEASVDHIVFTGSATVGRKLAARLGERLISSTMELSGCDALVVLPDANVPMAARAAWFGVTLNRGQTCVASRRFFVHRSIEPAFVAELNTLAAAVTPGRLALASQVTQARGLVADAVAHGAALLDSLKEPFNDNSADTMKPVVLTGATPEMAVCREAAFAPIAAVLAYDSTEQLIDMDRRCPFGLGSSIFGDRRTAVRLASQLQTGMVSINDALVASGHPATPFGGVRQSGWGSTKGEEGLLGMTVPQVISTKSGSLRPHYAPVDQTPALAGATRALLLLTHGTPRDRWQGLKLLLKSARKMV